MNTKKPVTKVLTLTPDVTRRQEAQETFGYLGGDLPFLNVETFHGLYTVRPGQVVPTFGQSYQVFNTFSRTGRAEVVMNAPINLNAHEHMDRGFLDFFAEENLPAPSDGKKMGFGYYVKRGAVRFKVEAKQQMDVVILPGVTHAMMDARPAGFMEREAKRLTHPNGDEIQHVTQLAGEYSDGLAAQWIAATNYTRARTEIGRLFFDAELVVEGGSAVIFHRDSADLVFQARIKATELGDPYGGNRV